MNGKLITEFIGLKPNVYAFKTEVSLDDGNAA